MTSINSKLGNVLHELFELGVFIKGFNGLWETTIGLLALSVSKVTLNKALFFLARGELLEDSRDRFLNFMAHAFQNLSPGAKTFAAIYILAHGLLNIFLAIQLYRNKLWAYGVTIGAMILFMFYQVYRINLHHSRILTLITIFDFFFIILTWREYRRLKVLTKEGQKSLHQNIPLERIN